MPSYTVTIISDAATATLDVPGDYYSAGKDYLEVTTLKFFSTGDAENAEIHVADGHSWSVVKNR